MLVKMLSWWARVFAMAGTIAVFQRVRHEPNASSWGWAVAFYLCTFICCYLAIEIKDRSK